MKGMGRTKQRFQRDHGMPGPKGDRRFRRLLPSRVPRIRPDTIARLERRAERIEARDIAGDYSAEMAIHQEISDCERAMTWWEKRA